VEGRISADGEDLAASTVALTFGAGALTVLAEGEPAGDPAKVQEVMRGPRVLDVARFPQVTFRSRAVAGRVASPGVYELQVTGDLSVHGITRAFTLPVKVEVGGDGLTASGVTVIRHDQFGMEPVSVAGVVKVKNEIRVTYRFVARAGP
jgi:polyisoprenoid-binding protein YceI